MKTIRQLARSGFVLSRRALRRRRWDESAHWFRLRYPEAGQIQVALNLLSRHTDRLGFRLRVEEGVAQLYIGVSGEAVARVFQEMAQDMGFRLTAAVDVPLPLAGRFTPAQVLVGEGSLGEAVDAYLVREHLFTLSGSKQSKKGLAFPESGATNGQEPGTWTMPRPELGIAIRPEWIEPSPPELAPGDKEDWILGKTPDGLVLACRQICVYGAADSAVEWLARLVLTRIAHKSTGLVVIDGRGDLAPRLLSDPSMARLRRNKQITHLDVNVAGQGGVNSLATRPDEDPAQVLERWSWWFSGMGVAGRALALLPKAVDAGVSDLSALYEWLKSQTGDSFAAAASFRAVLEQLMRNQVVNRWLTMYPIEIPATLEAGVLLVSCPQKGSWSRLQAIRAVMSLAAGPETDFVLHQIPLDERDFERIRSFRIVIKTNNLNSTSTIDTTVLTRIDDNLPDKLVAALPSVSRRIEPGHDGQAAGYSHALLTEFGQCLRDGEALVVRGEYVSWCLLEQGMKSVSVVDGVKEEEDWR